jgi:hypothetical protein
MNSFDVIKTIISNNNLEKSLFFLYSHDAVKNWRQINSTMDKKIENINTGIQFDTYNLNSVSGETLLNLHNLDGFVKSHCPLVSFASNFFNNERSLHIAMMNLHLSNKFTFNNLINSLHSMTQNKFWLLKTDRFYHIYSDSLLNHNDWLKWNLKFLMTDCLVSPRYIGHSLERNFNLLRQNATSYIKTKIPTVIYNSN